MTILSILGVDGGETTGLALFTVLGDRIAPEQQFQLPWYEATLWVEEVCATWIPGTLLVGCERFVISAGTVRADRGDNNWTIEAIGCARRDAQKHGHRFTLKGASDAKKFVSNQNLKKVGWDCPTPGNHARDATRIAIITAADELKIVPPWV